MEKKIDGARGLRSAHRVIREEGAQQRRRHITPVAHNEHRQRLIQRVESRRPDDGDAPD